jgi:hypothetical protein
MYHRGLYHLYSGKNSNKNICDNTALGVKIRAVRKNHKMSGALRQRFCSRAEKSTRA